MKKTIIALNLIFILSIFAVAQKQRTNPEDYKQNNSGENEKMLKAGTSFDAMLNNSLDVRKTEVGDKVILKTTKNIKQDGQVVIPKGTKLIGRITEIQEKTKNQSFSKIGMIFERIEGKNISSNLNLSIISIINSNGHINDNDLFSNETTSTSITSGKASSGGGLLGGATSTVGGLLKTTTSTVGEVKNTASQTLENTVDGIQISQSSKADVSGSSTLSAEGKNLRLNKGVYFRLIVNEAVEN